MIIIITAFIFLFVSFGLISPAYADLGNEQQTLPDNQLQVLVGSWKNQRGSTLTINKISPNGLLTGTYVNRAPGYRCQGIRYPVIGWIYKTGMKTLITFTTKWQSKEESCESITAWTGFSDKKHNKLQTLWQLVWKNDQLPILTGYDIFSRR